MGLRETAATDLRSILTDVDGGFGWAVSVISPDETSVDLTGFSTDIAYLIDPQTGEAVHGRTASVALPLADVLTAFVGELPRNVPEANRKPWRVQFADIGGTSHLFKVQESNPDRAIGILTMRLEAYKVSPP